jgi:hypothetical protein
MYLTPTGDGSSCRIQFYDIQRPTVQVEKNFGALVQHKAEIFFFCHFCSPSAADGRGGSAEAARANVGTQESQLAALLECERLAEQKKFCTSRPNVQLSQD